MSDQDFGRIVRKLGLLHGQASEIQTNSKKLVLEIARAERVAKRMTNADLQSEITKWARETFDVPDQDHRLTKLGNEFEELRRLTTTDRANQAGIAGECADIMHLMFQIAEAWDFDLLEQTRKKFKINKQRTWKPQLDGTYQHVEGGSR